MSNAPLRRGRKAQRARLSWYQWRKRPRHYYPKTVPFDGDKDRYLKNFASEYLFPSCGMHNRYTTAVDRKWKSITGLIMQELGKQDNGYGVKSILLGGSVPKKVGMILNRDVDILVGVVPPENLVPVESTEVPQHKSIILGDGLEGGTILSHFEIAARAALSPQQYTVTCSAPSLTVSTTVLIGYERLFVSFDILPSVKYQNQSFIPMQGNNINWRRSHTTDETKHVERMVKEIGRLRVLHPLRLLRLFKLMRNWALPSCAFDHTLMRLFDERRVCRDTSLSEVVGSVLAALADSLSCGVGVNHYFYNGEDLLQGTSPAERAGLLHDVLAVLENITIAPWDMNNVIYAATADIQNHNVI